jgi:hypothetical protein
VVDNAPLLIHATLGRYSAAGVKLLLKHGASVKDPFTRLVRDKERLATAQLKNAARFTDNDMWAEHDDETADKLSMTVEVGGYMNSTRGASLLACAWDRDAAESRSNDSCP